MKDIGKVLRIVKAIQVFCLGCEIEIKRKRLEVMIKVQKTLTSDSVIRMSNELSRLGIKWMALSAKTRCYPIQDQ